MKYLKYFESIDYSEIRIGDRVIVNGVQDGLQIDNKIGTVIRKTGISSIVVMFDEKFSDKLHSEQGMCWTINIEKVSVNKEETKYLNKDLRKILPILIDDDELVKSGMIYLDTTDKIDLLSFLPIRFKDEEDPYNSPRRQEIKIGKFLRKVKNLDSTIMSMKSTGKALEEIINKYKSNYKRFFNLLFFEMVDGEDIRKWYDSENYVEGGGKLNKSCMRHKKHQHRFDIYTENPDVCKLLILKEDKDDKLILGRALVWKTSRGMYMDRPYCRYDEDEILYKKYADEREWLFYNDDYNLRMSVNLINKNFGSSYENPYMDTFKKYYYKVNKLTNYSVPEWGEQYNLNDY